MIHTPTRFVDFFPMPYQTSASAGAYMPRNYYMTSAPASINSADLVKFRAISNRFSNVSAEELDADIEAAFREVIATRQK